MFARGPRTLMEFTTGWKIQPFLYSACLVAYFSIESKIYKPDILRPHQLGLHKHTAGPLQVLVSQATRSAPTASVTAF